MENNMEAKASNGYIIHTGDMVLVRESDTRTWFVSLFSYKIKDNYFICANGSSWAQCIPLKNNEHLCGTNDEYEEPYIPKFGDMVEGITSTGKRVKGVLLTYKNIEDHSYPFTVFEEDPSYDGFGHNVYLCKSIEPIQE